MGKICMEDYTFVIMLCFLLLINVFLAFYAIHKNNHKQQIESTIFIEREKENENVLQKGFINDIYNPLVSPSVMYQGNYDSYNENQMTGFLNGPEGQFPVFSRQHTPGRSDRMEYYTMNESRNKIKIPIFTRNYTEIYDGDAVEVPELGGPFMFKKYENRENRYN